MCLNYNIGGHVCVERLDIKIIIIVKLEAQGACLGGARRIV